MRKIVATCLMFATTLCASISIADARPMPTPNHCAPDGCCICEPHWKSTQLPLFALPVELLHAR